MSEKRDLLASIGGAAPTSPDSAAPPAPAQAMPTLRASGGDASASPAPGFAPPPTAAPIAPNASFTFEEPEARYNRPLILGVLGVGLIAAVVALLTVFMPAGAAVVPSGFDDFAAPDESFTMKTPVGWKRRASGMAAGDKDGRMDGVYSDSGAAHMEVTFSTVSGLVQSQLLYGKDMTPEAMTGSRASGVDNLQKPAVKHKFKGYTEKTIEDVPGGMGGVIADEKTRSFKPDATMHEFTATSDSWGLGGPVHGYRAVLSGSKLIAAVLCYCPEKEWTKLEPSFRKFIGGVQEKRDPNADPNGGGIPGGGLPDTSAPVGIPNGLVPGGGGQ